MATIQPYLFFRGRCEEAIKFYEKALGAKVGMMMRFKDNPDEAAPESAIARVDGDRISRLRYPERQRLMSDGKGRRTGASDRCRFR